MLPIIDCALFTSSTLVLLFGWLASQLWPSLVLVRSYFSGNMHARCSVIPTSPLFLRSYMHFCAAQSKKHANFHLGFQHLNMFTGGKISVGLHQNPCVYAQFIRHSAV